MMRRLKRWVYRLFRHRQPQQMPFPHPISKSELDELFEKTEQNLHALSKTVLDGLKPPAGAYAFFNHSSQCLSRLKDCHRIVNRLFRNRHELTRLALDADRLRPHDWPAGSPYPENLQKVMRSEDEINGYMQLDMETLYVFGWMLLDQWALQAIAVGDLPLKKEHPFAELVRYLEKNPNSRLQPLWDQLRGEMLWLYFQVRFYRNRFIVHPTRPWQRGTTRSSYGEDYNLFIPTPPGWLDDKQLDREITALLHLAPEYIQKAADDYWEKARPGRLIEIIFDRIGEIGDPKDRERVAELFGKKGGTTPTFRVIAKKLFGFVAVGTESLNGIAGKDLSLINLGRPHKTSDEMWRDRD